MIHRPAAGLLAAALLAAASPAAAQDLSAVFGRVRGTVVVVRTIERASPSPGRRDDSGRRGLGSGVVISADGRILTAAHLVQSVDAILVELPDGREVPAHVVASAPPADVALIQLAVVPDGLTAATLGDSDRMAIGDQVLVVGAAYGLGPALTVGHLGARILSERRADGRQRLEMFQTDAAMNPGNSGGPMFNRRGEVVGIVSAILTESGGFEGVGFAVTSNLARRLLVDQRGYWSGADGYLVRGEVARALNVPQSAGVLVQRVARGSPAAGVGLRAGRIEATIGEEELIAGGDIILAVAGIPVDDGLDALERVHAAVSRLQPGVEYRITVLRGGARVELIGVMPGP